MLWEKSERPVSILDFPFGLPLFVTLGAALGKERTFSGVNTIFEDDTFSFVGVVGVASGSALFGQGPHLGLYFW